MIGAFLRSRKNLLGLVLAIGGVAVTAAGVLPLVAGVPVIVCLYLAGVIVGPAVAAPEAKFEVTGNDAQIKTALETLLREVQGRVPEDVLLRVQSIRNSILATLGDPNTAPGAVTPERSTADPNIYLIQQTALNYLPTALEAYISLPKRYTSRDLPGRKNAHQMLLAQLDLMDEKLAEVTDAILARDAQRLEVYGRFIQEKFGSSRLDLDKFDMAQAARAAAGADAGVKAPVIAIPGFESTGTEAEAADTAADSSAGAAAPAAAPGPGGESVPAQPPMADAQSAPRTPDTADDVRTREREAVRQAAIRAQATAERLREAARVAQQERDRVAQEERERAR